MAIHVLTFKFVENIKRRNILNIFHPPCICEKNERKIFLLKWKQKLRFVAATSLLFKSFACLQIYAVTHDTGLKLKNLYRFD